jgi:hypothetical protein
MFLSGAGIQCQRGIKQATIRTALDSRQKHAGMTGRPSGGRRSAGFRPIVFKIDYAGTLDTPSLPGKLVILKIAARRHS